MIRTVVCEKEGCSSNRFYIQNKDNRLELICNQCKAKYQLDISQHDFIMLPNCSKCNNEIFKVFKDTEKKSVYAKCIECGGIPEKVYIDSDGIQVSYEGKLLNSIKETMELVEQRMHNLEVNVKDLEQGQGLLEQSLAYINRYLVNQN
ncbi:hypothetical protein JCM1393_10140 [Clostridium carnis]